MNSIYKKALHNFIDLKGKTMNTLIKIAAAALLSTTLCGVVVASSLIDFGKDIKVSTRASVEQMHVALGFDIWGGDAITVDPYTFKGIMTANPEDFFDLNGTKTS